MYMEEEMDVDMDMDTLSTPSEENARTAGLFDAETLQVQVQVQVQEHLSCLSRHFLLPLLLLPRWIL